MNFTGTKIFFDTNILCYALDNYDSAKKQKAENIISNAVKSSNVYISTQVITEDLNNGQVVEGVRIVNPFVA